MTPPLDGPTESRLPSGALLIGERRIDDASGGALDHVNAATGAVHAQFTVAGSSEVDDAVRAARAAAPAWRRTPPSERRRLLERLADLVEAGRPELGLITALESGTPVSMGSGGGHTVAWLRYYAGWAERLHGDVLSAWPEPALDYTVYEPVGVVAALIPWNGPLTSIGQKVAPALAAGNTVVLKPSELAPFAALRFGELCLEAGIPPGVVNVIPGGPEAGDHLVRHPDVDKISFTGSGPTGAKIVAAAAANLTPVMLELGGKSANLVFADADLDAAVPLAVMTGIIVASGQGCVLPTRLVVEEPIYDEVVARIPAVLETVRIGDPVDPATTMGPVITEQHCRRILDVISRATTDGDGSLLLGGSRHGDVGFFVEPTVFVDVEPASRLAQEEVFGPVLSVIPVADEAAAIEVANSTRYGLGGLVFTKDVGRAHRLAGELQAGYIGVNAFPTIPPYAPFGGIKQSGWGREGGLAGLLELCTVKNIYVKL